MAKKESRKEKESRLRREEEIRLREEYQEGQSNVLWDEYFKTAREVWFKEVVQDDLPKITKEEYIARELKKFDERRPKVPVHKVHDPERQTVFFHHRFVTYFKEVQPDAVEELRPLSDAFGQLFFNKGDKDFAVMIDDLRDAFFDVRLFHPLGELRTEFDYDYVWGELFNEFQIAHLSFLLKTTDAPNLPDNEKVIRYIASNSYLIDSINRVLQQHFEKTTQHPDSVLANFFRLHGKIYDWINKYHLKKDWLVNYAYYFINQFHENPQVQVANILVGMRLYHPRTLYFPFEFKSKAWWAAEDGESSKEFESRTRQEFESALERYMEEASSFLKLDQFKKITKPMTYDSVEWLVHRTVKGWHTERIVEKFFPKLSNSATDSELTRRAFASKKKHVDSEMRKLKEFGLPWYELR